MHTSCICAYVVRSYIYRMYAYVVCSCVCMYIVYSRLCIYVVRSCVYIQPWQKLLDHVNFCEKSSQHLLFTVNNDNMLVISDKAVCGVFVSMHVVRMRVCIIIIIIIFISHNDSGAEH